MTRLKKELIRKTTSNDRIRRIKDQKKIVNSKTSTKISEIHLKKLLENVEEQTATEQEATMLFETNNNINDTVISNGSNHKSFKTEMADTEEKEVISATIDENAADDVVKSIDKKEEIPQKVEEEMQDFELVGLSPESEKSKSDVKENVDDAETEVKNDLTKELETEANEDVESDEEEPNRRRKSAKDGESEEGRNDSNNESEDGDNDGADESEVSDYHSASENEEKGSGQQSGVEEDGEKEGDEEVKSPTFVPRRTGFWDHDDRFSDIRVQESREPPQGSKKLWDKSEVDRWQHDKYNEAEQGPKETWEVEQSMRDFEEGRQRRGGDRPRGDRTHGDRQLGDFVQEGNRGRRGGRGGGSRRSGDGQGRQYRSYNDRSHEQQEDQSQDYRMNSKNKEDWPTLNQKQYNNRNRNDNRRKNQNSKTWGADTEGGDDWSGKQDAVRKPNKRQERTRDQEYPYKSNRNNEQRNYRNESNDSRENNRAGREGSEEKQTRRQDKRRSHDNNDDRQPQQRADEYPKKSDNSNKLKNSKSRGRGRGRQNEVNEDYPPGADNEKSNREKRIDSLPPRLRDKAREKMEQDRSKGKQNQDDQNEPEPGQFEDQPLTTNERQDDDGGSRDKPKRYSSQRQKSGASMMDIPSQIQESEEARQYLEQLNYLQQQMSPDKNIRALEQQILQLQTQLQQQLNLRTIQPPMMSQPNMGMQMPNMVSPMVPGVEQVYGSDSAMYNMAQAMLPNATGGDAMGLLNPQINPMILNQILAAAQQQQQPQQPTGLYLPPQQQPVHPQSPPSQQPTAQQLSEAESRKSRPAAIPIKPPPGLNHP